MKHLGFPSVFYPWIALALLASVCYAEPFPDTITVADRQLSLVGTGVLRFKRVIPVYDAALYLGQDTEPDQALQDVAKRLEVVYRVTAEASRFHAAGEALLQQRFTMQELAAVRGRLDRLNDWYPDARKGDRCAIQYLPGHGTELLYNDQSLGVIPGADFARIYFSIWLGDQPACKRLRTGLLGRS